MRFLYALIGLFFCTSLAAQSLPAPQGFVTDYTQTLSPAQRNDLNNRLTAYAQQSSNEVAVALLNLPEGEDLETYTNTLARAWKIGQAKNNNGVLLVVYKNARKIRIEVGYGLEPVITDGRAKLLITEIIAPKLKQGDYAGGLSAGADELCALASKEFNKTQLNKRYYSKSNEASDIVRIIFGVIVLIIASIVGIIMVVSHGNGGNSRRRYRDRYGNNGSGGGFFFWGGWGGGSGGGSGNSGDSSGGDFGGFSGGDFGGGGSSGDF